MSKDVATQTGIDMESPSVGPSKYVSVVYHHMSYQDGAGYVSAVELTEKSALQPMEDETIADIPDYLVFTILSFFIFFPVGNIAVTKSIEVIRARRRADKMAAMEASTKAIQYALIAFVITPFIITLIVPVLCLTVW